MNDQKAFWNNIHVNKYAKADWIDKHTIFVEQVKDHFPTEGKLLELGAGHGQDTRYFAGMGYEVVATDFSEEALRFNREKLHEDLSQKVSFHQVDMSQSLPFEDEHFDVVYSHLAVHYFTKVVTQALFDEIYRVLKPGGVVALLTNSTSDPEYGTGEMIEEDMYLLNGEVIKRFFSVETMLEYTTKFETVLLDNQGTTHKDSAIGVYNLIRYVGRKI